MSDKVFNVLFICTGNSARSILGEALLNEMRRGRFRAFSAGSHPKGSVHALAVRELQRRGISTEGLRSKGWEEFARPGAPEMDFIFTVCDQAAGEVCPVWPGQPMTAHWGTPDPAAAGGTEEEKAHAFLDAAITLKRRLDLFLSLPITSLDSMSLRKQVSDIGTR
jgi:protein-tyrosine-phosphatase